MNGLIVPPWNICLVIDDSVWFHLHVPHIFAGCTFHRICIVRASMYRFPAFFVCPSSSHVARAYRSLTGKKYFTVFYKRSVSVIRAVSHFNSLLIVASYPARVVLCVLSISSLPSSRIRLFQFFYSSGHSLLLTHSKWFFLINAETTCSFAWISISS